MKKDRFMEQRTKATHTTSVADASELVALINENSALITQVKQVAGEVSSHSGYRIFKQHFMGLEPISDFDEISHEARALLEKQRSLAISAQKRLAVYGDFSELCFLKDRLSTPVCKLVILFQMAGAKEADIILDSLFEGKYKNCDGATILSNYHLLLDKLASKASDKNAFYDEFMLHLESEEPPANEKERKKREIRNNTILNFYKKHKDRMFLPDNMCILRDNLKKLALN